MQQICMLEVMLLFIHMHYLRRFTISHMVVRISIDNYVISRYLEGRIFSFRQQRNKALTYDGVDLHQPLDRSIEG